MGDFSERLYDTALDLLWSLWAELGVPGWDRRHGDWCIDPEPLIVLTAALAERDPRLRDETTGWWVRHARYVSAARLKNALPLFDQAVATPYADYAAMVGAHTGVRRYDARPEGSPAPRTFPPLTRSHTDVFDRPSQLPLRLRALFGVGARAEIVRALLAFGWQPAGVTPSDFPDALYTRRNIAEELESLRMAGLLAPLPAGARRLYALRNPAALNAIAAPLPLVNPRWTDLLPLLYDLLSYAASAPTRSRLVRAVEATRLAAKWQSALLTAGVPLAATVPNVDATKSGGEAGVIASFEEWSMDFVRDLARGTSRGTAGR